MLRSEANSSIIEQNYFNYDALLDGINSDNALQRFSDILATNNQWFDQQFTLGVEIRSLIYGRSHFFDRFLDAIWQYFEFDNAINLVAIGGYGRGELHPHSDIDLLLLLKKNNAKRYRQRIEKFLAFLWDLKLNIGQSVRTISQCISAAKDDITVTTSLMECRLIHGDQKLLDKLIKKTGPDKIWPDADFFAAKFEEQNKRHRRHGVTEYDLEPNVKESPGGLRDIQNISWVAKRHYRADNMHQIIGRSLFTRAELAEIRRGEELLWRVRYGMHMIAGRPQETLHFDVQRKLAVMFGYKDTPERLAVEHFMKDYYRTVMSIRLINELSMQHLYGLISQKGKKPPYTAINENFRLRGTLIETTSVTVFADNPSALLEIFIHFAVLNAEGIRAKTIRQIRKHLHLIDDKFRQDSYNKNLFLQICSLNYRLASTIQVMTRYEVLGRYLPEFGKIVGQMQHDLFHIYPVDVHTTQLLKNVTNFGREKGRENFPVAAEAYQRINNKSLLAIAGLYHDIGKGRGGDHSELGAIEVRRFASEHNLPQHEIDLLAWLVENHLLMSQISQKQDLSDPDVINKFALHVKDQLHLDLLYTLTVADVNATNPTLWNSWKASLMRQLHAETTTALQRGLKDMVDKDEIIQETYRESLKQLVDMGYVADVINKLWSKVGDDYFLQESVANIAWQTSGIYNNFTPLQQPLILIKSDDSDAAEGATQVFIRIMNRDNLFASLTHTFEKLNFNIQGARLYCSETGFTLDTFYILDHNNQPIGNDPQRFERIRQAILKELTLNSADSNTIYRRTPRQLKHFAIPTTTTLVADHEHGYSVLTVITADRVGLLAQIGSIFVDFNIRVSNAKITTLGERVEDTFYLTTFDDQPIDDEQGYLLQAAICKQIDQQIEQSA